MFLDEDGRSDIWPEALEEDGVEEVDVVAAWGLAGSNSGADGRRGSEEMVDGAGGSEDADGALTNTTGTDSVDEDDDARDLDRTEPSPAVGTTSSEASTLLSGVAVPPRVRPSVGADSSGSGPLKILSLASSYSACRSS